MTDSPTPLARLKRRLERLERPRLAKGAGAFLLGEADVDARLEGGLARGALHEVEADADDHASASAFALMLAARGAGDRPILWVREDKGARMHGRLYGPGLVELGIDPDRVLLVEAPDTLAALRAGADGIAAMGAGVVVIEPFGAARLLDLTASRRLVLAAERSGAVALVLRTRGAPVASAASTRWAVATAPSVPLPGNAPGHTALAVDLVRHRGGVPPFSLVLEWDRDRLVFRKSGRRTALPRVVPADPARRPLAA